MIFIENEGTDAAFNLALEESLFERAQQVECEFVSLWRNAPSVIVGRYQDAAEEVNQDFTEGKGIKTVRRITGGGAVYHDLGNLNYTIIKELDVDFDASVLPKITAGILVSMGLPAVVSGRNDILVDGKKISGYAQHSAKNILLHHGTLLFDSDLENLIKSLTVKTVRERVSNIKLHLPPQYSHFNIADFYALMKEKFTEKFNITESRPPTKHEIERAEFLKKNKYDTRSAIICA